MPTREYRNCRCLGAALGDLALDAYDREVVQKGYLLAGGLVGAVLLAIVLVIVL